MRLSSDKVNVLSHRLAHLLSDHNHIKILKDDNEVRLRIKNIVLEEMRLDEEVEEEARRSVASLSRKVIEGSPEWDILYQKAYEDILNRRRPSLSEYP